MRIIQFLPTLAFGDAVGNDTLALQKAMRELGYSTEIYAEAVDQRLPKGTAKDLCSGMPELTPEDVMIYHMSTGSELNYNLEKYPCRKMMIYHNITPPEFFSGYNLQAKTNAQYGLDGLKHLAGKIDYCLADSAFNAEELKQAGFTCPIEVRPILIPFEDYAKEGDKKIFRQYTDDIENIIFVGRIAPNKKQEDVIKAFAFYQNYIQPKSRLIFVGNWNGMEVYYQRLLQYVQALQVENVIFTGHISFAEILSYYRTADLFLCMSEHEGFCVPLVEAMYFKIPILAYASSAIPWTLGGSGFLTRTKNPIETAFLMNKILHDETLKEKIIANQNERLKDFQYEKIKSLFAEQLKRFLGETAK